MADPQTFAKDDRYPGPFSSGTEHMMWLDANCSRGEKGCHRDSPRHVAAGQEDQVGPQRGAVIPACPARP